MANLGLTQNFFDEVYFASLSSRFDADLTSKEVDWIARNGGLHPGARVLDLGCGEGRHAIALAELGYHVTGVDASIHAIALASQEAAIRGLKARFHSCNASEFAVSAPEFDLVISWQTSLGIVSPGNDDLRTIQNAFGALRPGGVLLVEFTSAPWILRNYTKRAWRVTPAGLEVIEERDYCARRGVIATVSRVVNNGAISVPRKLEIRLYTAPEMIGLLAEAGFVDVDVWGDLEMRPYSIDSRRLLLRAAKPQKN